MLGEKTVKMKTWLESHDLIACHLAHLDQKRFNLPENTVCFANFKDGTQKMILPPQEISSKWEAQVYLFKTSDIVLTFPFFALTSKEGFCYTGKLILQFCLEFQSKNALFDFATHFLKTPFCTLAQLEAYFSTTITPILQRFYFEHYAEALMEKSSSEAQLGQDLKTSLQEKSSQVGLKFLQLQTWQWDSEDFQKWQDLKKQQKLQEEARKTEEARLQAEKEILSLSEAQEKEQALKRQQWLRELSEQDLAYRSEQEKKLFETRLELAKKALDEFQGNNVASLVAQLEDPRDRSTLLKMFIEKEMTPEQLEARLPSNLSEIDQKIERLQEIISKAFGEKVLLHQIPQSSTHLLLLATGSCVFGYDPKNLKNVPTHEWDFGEQLGGLRSVSLCSLEGESYLLVGAVHGIYLKKLNSQIPFESFAFPKKTQGRNGCNSVTAFQDFIYATHSEQHFWRWHWKQYTSAEQLLEPILKGYKNVRGITCFQDTLYLAGDQSVYGIHPLSANQVEKRYLFPHSILSFVFFSSFLYVGTQEGILYRVPQEEPEQIEIFARFPEPIYSLKWAYLRNEPHLLLGNKQYGVLTLSLQTQQQTLYQSEQPIRWIDGHQDYLFGVETQGYHCLVWEADRPQKILEKIHVNAPIQDLCLWKR